MRTVNFKYTLHMSHSQGDLGQFKLLKEIVF